MVGAKGIDIKISGFVEGVSALWFTISKNEPSIFKKSKNIGYKKMGAY